jgi:hypothetical protein
MQKDLGRDSGEVERFIEELLQSEENASKPEVKQIKRMAAIRHQPKQNAPPEGKAYRSPRRRTSVTDSVLSPKYNPVHQRFVENLPGNPAIQRPQRH